MARQQAAGARQRGDGNRGPRVAQGGSQGRRLVGAQRKGCGCMGRVLQAPGDGIGNGRPRRREDAGGRGRGRWRYCARRIDGARAPGFDELSREASPHFFLGLLGCGARPCRLTSSVCLLTLWLAQNCASALPHCHCSGVCRLYWSLRLPPSSHPLLGPILPRSLTSACPDRKNDEHQPWIRRRQCSAYSRYTLPVSHVLTFPALVFLQRFDDIRGVQSGRRAMENPLDG